MSDAATLRTLYGARIEALARALERGDGAGFLAELDVLVQQRQPELLAELRDLTCNLQVALDRFRIDARIADLAEKDIPDARERLAHVVRMTDEAAHRTLDLVEQSGPPAERTARDAAALAEVWRRFRGDGVSVAEFRELLERMDAFLRQARADGELIRRNLAEVLLAQGYQDLTGQIIRGVMQLVGEIETALADLARLSGARPPEAREERRSSRGYGPAIPGVTRGEFAAGQQDVDALLSGLGV